MLDVVVCSGPPPTPGTGRLVNVWRDDKHQAFGEAMTDGEGYRVEWRGLGTLTFTPGSLRVRLWPTPGLDVASAVSTTLRVVQPVLLPALGCQTLHASAVHVSRGVIAFCGVSASGKSTLAFALGQRPGVQQMADDAVVLAVRPGSILVTPLPFRARLRAASQRFLGHGASAAVPDAALPERRPLLAVMTLTQRVSPGPLDVERIPAVSAFANLLTHAHCFDESSRPMVTAMVHAYLTVAEIVPIYRLTYSADFSRLAALQDRVLELVGATSADMVDVVP